MEIHHRHIHFRCKECGELSLLTDQATTKMQLKGAWAEAFKRATLTVEGSCPECSSGS